MKVISLYDFPKNIYYLGGNFKHSLLILKLTEHISYATQIHDRLNKLHVDDNIGL